MDILTEEGARPSSSGDDAATLSRARLTGELKSRARALGFQKVGVARAPKA